jgi:hypothetical protein
MTHSPHAFTERRDDYAATRDAAADRRDHVADERDRDANDRDAKADQRAVLALDHGKAIVTRMLEGHAEITAQLERLEQSETDPDRRDALTRARTAVDDIFIEVLREFSLMREQRHSSSQDRGFAAADRCASAQDRTASAQDRFDSAGDRNQAAIEREEIDDHPTAADSPQPIGHQDSTSTSRSERAIAQSRQRLAGSRDLLTRLGPQASGPTEPPRPNPEHR